MRDTSVRGILFAVVLATVGACSWGSDSGGGGTGGVDAGLAGANDNARCGDGTCAASEVDSCPQDCGDSAGHTQPGGSNAGSDNNGGSNTNTACGDFVCDASAGEDATTCPADCSGQGGGGGGGGGSGSLDCSDENTVLACALCEIGGGCSGVDPTSCAACGF